MLHPLLCLLVVSSLPGTPLFPGGVLDSTGRTAYLATPAGVEAIALGSGDRLWRSPDAHRPLLVVGDLLYALSLHPSSRLEVVALDLTVRGTPRWRTAVPHLPRWVVTKEGCVLPGVAECAFQTNWQLVRSTLHLEWHATVRPETGPAKNASGRFQIDLDSGKLQQLNGALLTPRQSTTTFPQLEKLAVRWQMQTAEQLIAVVQEPVPAQPSKPRQQSLVLCAWGLRSGQLQTRRELLTGHRPVLMPDLQGHNLWIRDAIPIPDGAEFRALEARHHWAVVSPLDGQLINRVPFIPGTITVTLIEDRAYCLCIAPPRRLVAETPRRQFTLHAIDLQTGSVLWQRTLGESDQASSTPLKP